eukprot:m51a1_g13885 hypothetical protein (403) ;mRNA; f:659240-660651
MSRAPETPERAERPFDRATIQVSASDCWKPSIVGTAPPQGARYAASTECYSKGLLYSGLLEQARGEKTLPIQCYDVLTLATAPTMFWAVLVAIVCTRTQRWLDIVMFAQDQDPYEASIRSSLRPHSSQLKTILGWFQRCSKLPTTYTMSAHAEWNRKLEDRQRMRLQFAGVQSEDHIAVLLAKEYDLTFLSTGPCVLDDRDCFRIPAGPGYEASYVSALLPSCGDDQTAIRLSSGDLFEAEQPDGSTVRAVCLSVSDMSPPHRLLSVHAIVCGSELRPTHFRADRIIAVQGYALNDSGLRLNLLRWLKDNNGVWLKDVLFRWGMLSETSHTDYRSAVLCRRLTTVGSLDNPAYPRDAGCAAARALVDAFFQKNKSQEQEEIKLPPELKDFAPIIAEAKRLCR